MYIKPALLATSRWGRKIEINLLRFDRTSGITSPPILRRYPRGYSLPSADSNRLTRTAGWQVPCRIGPELVTY